MANGETHTCYENDGPDALQFCRCGNEKQVVFFLWWFLLRSWFCARPREGFWNSSSDTTTMVVESSSLPTPAAAGTIQRARSLLLPVSARALRPALPPDHLRRHQLRRGAQRPRGALLLPLLLALLPLLPFLPLLVAVPPLLVRRAAVVALPALRRAAGARRRRRVLPLRAVLALLLSALALPALVLRKRERDAGRTRSAALPAAAARKPSRHFV